MRLPGAFQRAPALRSCWIWLVPISSWGKVESLKLYGRELPSGWALDADGNPHRIQRPRKRCFLLPEPAATGWLFSRRFWPAPLVGGRMPLHKTINVASEGSEHFFYAIDIQQFVELDDFYSEMDSTVAEIRQLPPADGFDRVRLPGELEWERTRRWKREGIPFHRDHVKKLEQIAAALKLNVPWRAS